LRIAVIGAVREELALGEHRAVAREFHTVGYSNHQEILDKVSAVSLAVPTTLHSHIGCALLPGQGCLRRCVARAAQSG
jgi:hypothetical protein